MLDVEALASMLAPVIAEEVAKAIGPLQAKIADLEARKPEKGDPGEPGKDAVAPTLKAVWDEARPEAETIIRAAVEDAVAALPKPKDGKDAANIVEALKDSGELVLTLEDGRLIRTGIRDGVNGEQGEPGFSLDDFDIERGDDGRTFTFVFERGDTRHSYELSFPSIVDAGVWKEAESYVPGEGVTWGGQFYICQEPSTGDKPDHSKDGKPWRLAVRKGRDGKDAKPNG